jgi:hypothetical protein
MTDDGDIIVQARRIRVTSDVSNPDDTESTVLVLEKSKVVAEPVYESVTRFEYTAAGL